MDFTQKMENVSLLILSAKPMIQIQEIALLATLAIKDLEESAKLIKRKMKTVKSLMKTNKTIAYNAILAITLLMENAKKKILSVRPTIT